MHRAIYDYLVVLSAQTRSVLEVLQSYYSTANTEHHNLTNALRHWLFTPSNQRQTTTSLQFVTKEHMSLPPDILDLNLSKPFSEYDRSAQCSLSTRRALILQHN